ncbi:hypothetical protein [Nonomuraea insulae]|uniref:hypothetical protein n=1 Tax=Nonomuraea insulae TaxID=1616787 RepID=UPI0036D21612
MDALMKESILRLHRSAPLRAAARPGGRRTRGALAAPRRRLTRRVPFAAPAIAGT